MSQEVLDFHEELMEESCLPEWMHDLNCPFCKEALPLRSIRNVRLCFNTRNMGDVAVEFICESCSIMDSIYYREGVSKVADFAALLVGKNKKPKADPVIEEEMYKMMYNNVMEKKAEWEELHRTKRKESNDSV